MILFPNLIELDCAPQENDYKRRMQQSTRVKVTDSRAPLLLLALLQAFEAVQQLMVARSHAE